VRRTAGGSGRCRHRRSCAARIPCAQVVRRPNLYSFEPIRDDVHHAAVERAEFGAKRSVRPEIPDRLLAQDVARLVLSPPRWPPKKRWLKSAPSMLMLLFMPRWPARRAVLFLTPGRLPESETRDPGIGGHSAAGFPRLVVDQRARFRARSLDQETSLLTVTPAPDGQLELESRLEDLPSVR